MENNGKVLLLNSDMSPLSITTIYRGFNLVFKGRAEVVEHDISKPIYTGVGEFKRPKVIKLVEYVSIPYRSIHLSRINVFKRDGFKCLYCGVKKDLTIDHVIPKSRGGLNTWENLVTCCHKCNKKKGQKTPEEANFVMSSKPFKPTHSYYMIKMTSGFNDDWEKYFKKK